VEGMRKFSQRELLTPRVTSFAGADALRSSRIALLVSGLGNDLSG